MLEKLQKQHVGITPTCTMQRMEKEYGLQTVYYNKKFVLISSSQDVLELATETLEDRYAATANQHCRLSVVRKNKQRI